MLILWQQVPRRVLPLKYLRQRDNNYLSKIEALLLKKLKPILNTQSYAKGSSFHCLMRFNSWLVCFVLTFYAINRSFSVNMCFWVQLFLFIGIHSRVQFLD